MKGWLVTILLLTGCAANRYIEPPRTPQQSAEVAQAENRIRPVQNMLYLNGLDFCTDDRPGCPLTVFVGIGDFYAGADTWRIGMSTQMVDYLQNADEIAMVLGHEWSHLLLRHQRSGNRQENEADCVGTGLTMRAGYDPVRGAQSLRRMVSTGNGILHSLIGGGTHPTWMRRYRAVLAWAARFKTGPITRARIRQVCGVAP